MKRESKRMNQTSIIDVNNLLALISSKERMWDISGSKTSLIQETVVKDIEWIYYVSPDKASSIDPLSKLPEFSVGAASGKYTKIKKQLSN